MPKCYFCDAEIPPVPGVRNQIRCPVADKWMVWAISDVGGGLWIPDPDPPEDKEWPAHDLPAAQA